MSVNYSWIYPKLSAKAAMVVTLLTIALASVLVLAIGHSSLFIKLHIILSIIALCLFLFLMIGLYTGLVIRKDPVHYKPIAITGDNIADGLANMPGPAFELGEGIAGLLLSLLIWIIASILFVLLILLAANIVIGLLFVLASIFYWIFYRAYRVIFLKHRKCKGDMKKSIGYGLLYTILYTGWFYGIIWVWRIVKTILKIGT